MGHLFTLQAGTYYDTLSAINGCDSIVILNLTVNTISINILQTGNTLDALTIGTVQWYDCNTNQIITGAMGNVYVPTVSGNYAAIITEGNCTDTSNCIQFFTGINSISNNTIPFSLYPNPTSKNITVEYQLSVTGTLTIFNLLGEQVHEISLEKNTTKKNISLTNIPSGIYFCVLRTEDGKISQQKFVVVK